MAYINLVGFETGDLTEAWFTSGSPVAQQSITGGDGSQWALRTQTVSPNSSYISLGRHDDGTAQRSVNTNKWFLRFNLIVPSALAAATIFWISNTTPGDLQFYAYLGTDMRIHARYSAAGVITEAANYGPIETGRKYCIEFATSGVGTAGAATYEMHVDEAVVFALSGLTICATPANTNQWLLGSLSGTTADFVFDDIAARDDWWPRKGTVQRFVPSSAGSYSQWITGTGSTFASVNQVPNDGDTTYIKNSTSGQNHSFNLTNTDGDIPIGNVRAVKVLGYVRDEGAASSVRLMLRSSATDAYGTAFDPGSTYALAGMTKDRNPAGTRWTRSLLDALEIGVSNQASQAMRCTALYCMADVTVRYIDLFVNGLGSEAWDTVGAATNWQAVQDYPPDEDTSYISKAGGNAYGTELWAIEDLTGFDTNEYITRVVLTMRARKNHSVSSDSIRGLLYDSAFAFPDENLLPLAQSTTYNDYRFTWQHGNAPGGVAFTVAKVNAMFIGLDFAAPTTHDIYITSAYLTVYFGTPSDTDSLGVRMDETDSVSAVPVLPAAGIRADLYSVDGLTKQALLTDITSAQYTLELDRIGSFELELPAASIQMANVSIGKQVWIYRESEGLVFKGVLEEIDEQIGDNGPVVTISGGSVARQLVYINTGIGYVQDGLAVDVAIGNLLLTTPWVVGTVDAGVSDIDVSVRHDGRSYWSALARDAELAGVHVRENPVTQTLDIGWFGDVAETFFSNFDNVSPIRDTIDLAPIVSLRADSSGKEIWNRVIAMGAGEGMHTFWSMPSNAMSQYLNWVLFTYQSGSGFKGDDMSFELTSTLTESKWTSVTGSPTMSVAIFGRHSQHCMRLVPVSATPWKIKNTQSESLGISIPPGGAGPFIFGCWIFAQVGTVVGKQVKIQLVINSFNPPDPDITVSNTYTLQYGWNWLETPEAHNTIFGNTLTPSIESVTTPAATDEMYIDQMSVYDRSYSRYWPTPGYENGVQYFYYEDGPSVMQYGERCKILQAKDIYPLDGTETQHKAAYKQMDRLVSKWLDTFRQPRQTFEVVATGLRHYSNGLQRVTVGDKYWIQFHGVVVDRTTGQPRAYKTVVEQFYLLGFTRSFNADGSDEWRLSVSSVDEFEDAAQFSLLQTVEQTRFLSEAAQAGGQQVTFNGNTDLTSSFVYVQNDPSRVIMVHRVTLIFDVELANARVNIILDGINITTIAGGPWNSAGRTEVDITKFLVQPGYRSMALVKRTVEVRATDGTPPMITGTVIMDVTQNPNQTSVVGS